MKLLASGDVKWAIGYLRVELSGEGLGLRYICLVKTESQLSMRFSWDSEKMKMPKRRKLSHKKFQGA